MPDSIYKSYMGVYSGSDSTLNGGSGLFSSPIGKDNRSILNQILTENYQPSKYDFAESV